MIGDSPINCVFWPAGTTDGILCAGEVHTYWIDDCVNGGVAEQDYCDAHAPNDDEGAFSERGFTPRRP